MHVQTSPSSLSSSPDIIPREKLDFDLNGDIPRYWFGGDPFKTRLFDALSTVFPEGERYFITCVRDYRDQVTDPKLIQDIKDFIRQEGQHGKVHGDYNQRLKAQGMQVDDVEAFTRNALFGVMRKRLPRATTLAHTAALEHLTAALADLLLQAPHHVADMDPRMRALYIWHGMEEVEHKAVAFDVLQQVAHAGYVRRILPFLFVSFAFPFSTFMILLGMLRRDGFTAWQCARIMGKGMWWLYKPGGFLWKFWRPYFSYFKPGFHPWHKAQDPSYSLWARIMQETGDPLLAGAAVIPDRRHPQTQAA
jgi:uncharacterized protein